MATVESELCVARSITVDNVLCLQNCKVYCFQIRIFDHLQHQWKAFLGDKKHISRKLKQNLVAIIWYFSDMPKLLPMMREGVFPIRNLYWVTTRDNFIFKTSKCVIIYCNYENCSEDWRLNTRFYYFHYFSVVSNQHGDNYVINSLTVILFL